MWVGLAPFYLDIDALGVLTGRAWLILAWQDHRQAERFDSKRSFGG